MVSVRVNPQPWTGSPEELAALFSRRCDVPITELLDAIDAGREIELARDVSELHAEGLTAWLAQLGLEASVIEGDGDETAAAAAPEAPNAWGNVLGDLLDEREARRRRTRKPPPEASAAQPRLAADVLDADSAPSASALPVAEPYTEVAPGPPLGAVFKESIEGDMLGVRSRRALAAREEHRPGVAGLLSVLAPGAGQAYNGDPHRGSAFAIGSLLVVPWVWSVVDALRHGREIRDGQRLMNERRRPRMIAVFIVAWWATLGGIYFAVDTLRALDEPVDTSSLLTVGEPGSGDGVGVDAEPSGPAEPELTDEDRRRLARPLLQQARAACLRGDFDGGLALVEQAQIIDESSRLAEQVGLFCRMQRDAPPPPPEAPSPLPDDQPPRGAEVP